MNSQPGVRSFLLIAASVALATAALAQPADVFRDRPPGGPGGPGGFNREERKIKKQFDANKDGWLNAEERKPAREFLAQDRASGGNRPRGPRGGRGNDGPPPQPGPKVSTSEVKSFPGAPLYASNVVRTLFFEFENADWEKELADFDGTDVEVPARLTVDGKTYPDVGVHIRGASSSGVGEGRKRPLGVSVDYVHEKQALLGYRTLNLLNSHGDPSFLRSVLFYQLSREYIPAPKANFVRVVINGESWGTYVNVEQFNKDFVQEWFGTTKGARWKVLGSPGGRGSLAYMGDDPEAYRKAYEIKSKDEPKAWADLIKLCKTLNETPSNKLQAALSPLLDIDGALRFLALDNALINNDGYWIRTSDYSLYQDEKGRFHVIPWDANETFAKPGGPGFGGGPGPAMMIAAQLFRDGDGDSDRKLTRSELAGAADAWFSRLDSEHTGKVSSNQFGARFMEIVGVPRGFGPPGGNQQNAGREPGRGGGSASMAVPVFAAVDADKDGTLAATELKTAFEQWFTKADAQKAGAVNEEQLRTALSDTLPAGGRGGPGRGPGGPGGNAPRINGVELDPLIAVTDTNKPLISKLLAVPELRQRYLGYVHEIAEKWLDWNRLGPIARQYHDLIAAEVKADTRKLDSTEDFDRSLTHEASVGRTISLKTFADQRRAYLFRATP